MDDPSLHAQSGEFDGHNEEVCQESLEPRC